MPFSCRLKRTTVAGSSASSSHGSPSATSLRFAARLDSEGHGGQPSAAAGRGRPLRPALKASCHGRHLGPLGTPVGAAGAPLASSGTGARRSRTEDGRAAAGSGSGEACGDVEVLEVALGPDGCSLRFRVRDMAPQGSHVPRPAGAVMAAAAANVPGQGIDGAAEAETAAELPADVSAYVPSAPDALPPAGGDGGGEWVPLSRVQGSAGLRAFLCASPQWRAFKQSQGYAALAAQHREQLPRAVTFAPEVLDSISSDGEGT